jgi:hypothetical protein
MNLEDVGFRSSLLLPIESCNLTPRQELRAPATASHVLTLRALDGTYYQPDQQESKIYSSAQPRQSVWQGVLLLLVGLLHRVLVLVSNAFGVSWRKLKADS